MKWTLNYIYNTICIKHHQMMSSSAAMSSWTQLSIIVAIGLILRVSVSMWGYSGKFDLVDLICIKDALDALKD